MLSGFSQTTMRPFARLRWSQTTRESETSLAPSLHRWRKGPLGMSVSTPVPTINLENNYTVFFISKLTDSCPDYKYLSQLIFTRSLFFCQEVEQQGVMDLVQILSRSFHVYTSQFQLWWYCEERDIRSTRIQSRAAEEAWRDIPNSFHIYLSEDFPLSVGGLGWGQYICESRNKEVSQCVGSLYGSAFFTHIPRSVMLHITTLSHFLATPSNFLFDIPSTYLTFSSNSSTGGTEANFVTSCAEVS